MILIVNLMVLWRDYININIVVLCRDDIKHKHNGFVEGLLNMNIMVYAGIILNINIMFCAGIIFYLNIMVFMQRL